MDFLKRINLKQPKYILPAILYPLLLFMGYIVIDIAHTKKSETVDPNMQTTDYINPNMPKAKVDEGLDSKYESMLKSYGKISDLSAIGNIERDEDSQATEEYETRYSEEEAAAMDSLAMQQARDQARAVEMQERLRQSAEKGESMQSFNPSAQNTESELLAQSRQRELELQAELERLRAEGQATVPAQVQSEGTVTVSDNAVTVPSGDEDSQQVVRRIRQSSDYFHTIAENDAQPDLIKAIIDEDIKATDGSRVRLRLLDDVMVGEVMMPKGSYLYAIMSGFSSQRVKGMVSSVLFDDEIIKVSLTLYDTDGLEGLYVPSSTFRETSKDVASGALSSNMNFNQGSYGNSLSQWGMQAVQNAYQRTTNAVSKAVKKNSAKLKYGTFVYLVNGRD